MLRSLCKIFLVTVITSIPTAFCLAQDWSVHGPYGGTITTIAVHPSDTSVVYAGTDKAGLYRSTDAGEHWQPINTGIPILHPYTQNLSADSLAILHDYYPITTIRFAPGTPDTIFAGTEGGGVVRSLNGGATWTPVNTGLPDSSRVKAIGIAPQSPLKLWCLTAEPTGGVYQSTDAGNTWHLVDALPHGGTYTWTAIAFVPGFPNTMYTGVTSAGDADTSWGLFRSTDGGGSWQLMSDAYSFYDVQINPADPTELWSVVYTGFLEWQLVHSTDAGVNWTLYPPDAPWTWVSDLRRISNATLYVKTGTTPYTLWRSQDFGETWTPLSSALPLAQLGYHDLATTPPPASTLYFATNAGVYRSRDGGSTGEEKSEGILNTDIHDLIVHPTNPEILYAGGNYGSWKSEDGGGSWQRLGVHTINEIAVDARHPDTLYFGGDGLVRTTNGGDTFESIYHNLTGIITAMSLLQDSTNQIIVGTVYYQYCFLFRTNNSGAHWDMVKLFHNGFLLQTLVQPPLLPSDLFLGTDAYAYTPMMRSTDRGRTWDEIWNRDVGMTTAIVPVPTAGESLYVATRGRGIRVSGDSAHTFRTINQASPAAEYTSVSFHRQGTAHLLAGSRYQGIYVSPYPEGAWHSVSGEYYPRITDIAFQSTRSRLVAATAGRGVWVGEEVALSTSRDSVHNTLPEQFTLNPPYPNPFNASTTLQFQLPKRQDTHIAVYDIKGQLIQTLVDQPMNPGIHTITWDGLNSQKQSVASGIYVIQVQLAHQVASRKVIYLK